MLPSKDQLTICFAHVAYRLRERFLKLATGIESFEVRDGRDKATTCRTSAPDGRGRAFYVRNGHRQYS